MLLLLLLEGGLRLAGYGYATGFFQTVQVAGKERVIENEQFSRRFFPKRLARRPLPISFPATKEPGVYRVFVMGESAAMGDPEPSFAFSRVLEVLLRERFPQTRFEIINVAFTAINSHVILPLARECAQHHGDLWVVYMGHNEVPGPLGPGTIFGGQGSKLWLKRASLVLRTTRVGQLLDALRTRLTASGAAPQTWRGLEMFLERQFRQDDPQMAEVYEEFSQNLNDMVRAAHRAGTEVILCTTASNLKDSAPFGSLHPSGWTSDQQVAWQKSYEPAMAAAAGGRFQEAVPLLRSCLAQDPRFAEAHFLLGHVSMGLDQRQEALPSFEAARDLDTLRFRADSKLNGIVEQTSQAWRDRGVYLCDTVKELSSGLPYGIPGEEIFFDHVHFKFDGNYLVARSIADQVLLRLPASLRKGDTGVWASAETCANHLGLSDWFEYQMYESLQRRLLEAPFTNQLFQQARQDRYRQRLTELRPALRPDGMESAAQICRDAVAFSPGDPRLHENLGRVLAAKGDRSGALNEFKQVVAAWPHHAAAYNNMGLLLQQLGRDQEAEEAFQQALARRPQFADAHHGLGLIEANRGHWDLAIALSTSAGRRIRNCRCHAASEPSVVPSR